MSLDAMTVLPLLRILEGDGLVYRAQSEFHLATPPSCISISAIVRSIDGDIAQHLSDVGAIADIERRIASVAVVTLDNFSLAEAIDGA